MPRVRILAAHWNCAGIFKELMSTYRYVSAQMTTVDVVVQLAKYENIALDDDDNNGLDSVIARF